MKIEDIIRRIDIQINQIEANYERGLKTDMLKAFKGVKIKELEKLREWILNVRALENVGPRTKNSKTDP